MKYKPLLLLAVAIVGLGVGLFFKTQNSPAPQKTTQKRILFKTQIDNKSAVTVAVTPISLGAGQAAVFQLELNTHSVELNYDLVKLAKLQDDQGNSYQAQSWSGGKGGHHLEGRLTFKPISKQTKSVTLILSQIDNQDRKFLWNLTATAKDIEVIAQNLNSLNGKILRVKDDGGIPGDNPFGNAVYSYGHRNAQGLAFDYQGRLWATEHGRSGLLSGFDEINLIEKGKNYGWSIIQGDEKRAGMINPILHSGLETTWAPAGALFYSNSLFFGGLRGSTLFEYNLQDQSLKQYFKEEFGRIRAVVLGPDGYFYITMSNTDGRGKVQVGDDKLIKINPKSLLKESVS